MQQNNLCNKTVIIFKSGNWFINNFQCFNTIITLFMIPIYSSNLSLTYWLVWNVLYYGNKCMCYCNIKIANSQKASLNKNKTRIHCRQGGIGTSINRWTLSSNFVGYVTTALLWRRMWLVSLGRITSPRTLMT